MGIIDILNRFDPPTWYWKRIGIQHMINIAKLEETV